LDFLKLRKSILYQQKKKKKKKNGKARAEPDQKANKELASLLSQAKSEKKQTEDSTSLEDGRIGYQRRFTKQKKENWKTKLQRRRTIHLSGEKENFSGG